MIKCPKCGHGFKDEGRAKGGKASKRNISKKAQAKMQAGRKKKPNDLNQTEGAK